MATLVVTQSHYNVISGGGKFRIQADVQGAANNNERKLIWSEPNGCVDSGFFNIPTVVVTTTYMVTVTMLEDLTQQEQIAITVNPKITPKKISELKVWQHGTFLTVQILDTEGMGFKGKVKLSEKINPAVTIELLVPNPLEKETDDRGSATISLNMAALAQAIDRTIHIQAMGSGQEEKTFLYKLKKEKCPRCDSSLWDGVKCPTCNYPKSRKAR